MDSIRVQKLADIPAPPAGYSHVTSSVANDGSLLFLSIEDTGADAVRETYASGIGIFPKTRMNAAKRFHLSIWRPTGPLQTIDLPELNLTFPLVDVFPDERILVVGPRCSWRGSEDYDLNAAVFDPKTAKMSRILLGDGISRAYVDARGRIWVAYCDEGIFGNFGWGGPGPTPVGAAGLVCFTDTGEKLWEYPGDADGMMADCYALNVSDSEAAIFFYMDFPICRISSDFKLAHWKTELRGCQEFAISKSAALFSGQYNDLTETAYLGRFDVDGRMNAKPVRLLLPDGSALPKGQLLGRGPNLYFFDTLNIYRVALD
jgi:hypothetical protein